jgi:hypothetical protein
MQLISSATRGVTRRFQPAPQQQKSVNAMLDQVEVRREKYGGQGRN